MSMLCCNRSRSFIYNDGKIDSFCLVKWMGVLNSDRINCVYNMRHWCRLQSKINFDISCVCVAIYIIAPHTIQFDRDINEKKTADLNRQSAVQLDTWFVFALFYTIRTLRRRWCYTIRYLNYGFHNIHWFDTFIVYITNILFCISFTIFRSLAHKSTKTRLIYNVGVIWAIKEIFLPLDVHNFLCYQPV